MTRRVWTTEDGWDVAVGWDRPLQHFFLDIGRECTCCGGSGMHEEDDAECVTCNTGGTEYVFNNLDAKEYTDPMGGMTLSGVESVLDKYLTVYPPDIMGVLYQDCDGNVGNDVRDFGTIGKVKLA